AQRLGERARSDIWRSTREPRRAQCFRQRATPCIRYRCRRARRAERYRAWEAHRCRRGGNQPRRRERRVLLAHNRPSARLAVAVATHQDRHPGGAMTVYDVGDQVPLEHKVYSSAGALTDATVTLTVTKPDASTTSPTITHSATGTYQADVTTDAAGIWLFRWNVSGTVPTDIVDGQFTVVTSAPPAYAALDDLKLALGITNDVTRDGLLIGALNTASRYVERKTGRRFYIDRTTSARVYALRGRLLNDYCEQ